MSYSTSLFATTQAELDVVFEATRQALDDCDISGLRALLSDDDDYLQELSEFPAQVTQTLGFFKKREVIVWEPPLEELVGWVIEFGGHAGENSCCLGKMLYRTRGSWGGWGVPKGAQQTLDTALNSGSGWPPGMLRRLSSLEELPPTVLSGDAITLVRLAMEALGAKSQEDLESYDDGFSAAMKVLQSVESTETPWDAVLVLTG